MDMILFPFYIQQGLNYFKVNYRSGRICLNIVVYISKFKKSTFSYVATYSNFPPFSPRISNCIFKIKI